MQEICNMNYIKIKFIFRFASHFLRDQSHSSELFIESFGVICDLFLLSLVIIRFLQIHLQK